MDSLAYKIDDVIRHLKRIADALEKIAERSAPAYVVNTSMTPPPQPQQTIPYRVDMGGGAMQVPRSGSDTVPNAVS